MTTHERQIALYSRMLALKNISAAQIDIETNSVGVSFNYLGVMYTAYIDVDTEYAELLQHDAEELFNVSNIGSSTANKLIEFFESLPKINDICE